MPRKRDSNFALPFEALLIGGWLALTVSFWVAIASYRAALPAIEGDVHALEASLAFRFGLAEVVLGGFLCMMVVRRRAGGAALLMPFAAFLIALLLAVVWIPMHRIARADGNDGGAPRETITLTHLRETRAGLDVGKVVILMALFLASERGARGRR